MQGLGKNPMKNSATCGETGAGKVGSRNDHCERLTLDLAKKVQNIKHTFLSKAQNP